MIHCYCCCCCCCYYYYYCYYYYCYCYYYYYYKCHGLQCCHHTVVGAAGHFTKSRNCVYPLHMILC